MRGIGNGFRLPGVVSVAIVLCAFSAPLVATAVHAEPPYLKFVEGLRDRRYNEEALYYLDQLAADATVPQDVKDVLDYERAVTLIGMARGRVDPATQAKRLEEATAALEKFVAAHRDHPLVAIAQSERGAILLGQARVAILQADAPGNESRAAEFRQKARQSIAKAREIFTNARDRYEQQWKAFGPFVDEDESQKREERNASLNALIQARMQLAECTYREAQTYKVDDPKRNQLLTAAAKLYEAIHADYRSQTGGLYARLWMAKCYEEQAPRPQEGQELSADAVKDARQKLNIAEAIYSELLEHDTRGKPSAAQMQEYAFWFKLIVRNHPALADYQLVVDQANEWLKTRTGAAAQAAIALGVRWERAQALELLANRRNTTEADRTRLLRTALSDAEFVNAYPGDYRDVSRSMISRIKAALGRGEGDPRDFDAASGLAQTLHNQISEKQDAVKAAKTPEEKTTAQQALAAHLDETARMLKLAMSLAGPGTDRAALNGVRYRLAVVEYMRDRPWDAAVIGEYLSRKFKDESPQVALDAAYVSMAAYTKLFNAAPAGEQKAFELDRLKRAAEFIGTSYPDSEQANEARMMVGRLYLKESQFAEAAEWFSKVPESSPQGMDARLLAGMTFWEAYAKATSLPDDQKLPQEELDGLAANAERFLRAGLALADKKLASETVPPDNVVSAKVTLAQIVNLNGKYQEAADLLAAGSQPVTKLVAVEDPKKRPKTGIKSVAFASGVHQQLLRAHIGLQQVEPAVQEMRILEQIGGEGNTAVFVQLGRQIKAELENLTAGQERDAVMAAFDQFLGNLSRMQQGQTYGSLVWIGETYFGLAQAAAEPKRSTYYDRAAASYEAILNRAQEPKFLPVADAINGVKLRLAAVESSRGNHAKAYDLAKQVLKAAPQALNAQVETATILGDWGRSGDADAPKQLLMSIQGDSSDPAVSVWGWGQIAQRLQRAIDFGQGNEEYKELHRRARYEIPAARRDYANQLSDKKQFEAEIGKAEKELLTYVATTPKDDIGDEWWSKLNALYGDIQRDQGIAVVKALEPAKEYAPASTAKPTAPVPGVAAAIATGPVSKPAASGGGSALPIVFGIVLAVAVTGGLVFMTMKGGKKPRRPSLMGTSGRPGAPVGPLDLSAFPAVEAGGIKPAAAVKKTAGRPAKKPANATGVPRSPSPDKPRPAKSEQPLVAKNVRRTKPSE